MCELLETSNRFRQMIKCVFVWNDQPFIPSRCDRQLYYSSLMKSIFQSKRKKLKLYGMEKLIAWIRRRIAKKRNVIIQKQFFKNG